MNFIDGAVCCAFVGAGVIMVDEIRKLLKTHKKHKKFKKKEDE